MTGRELRRHERTIVPSGMELRATANGDQPKLEGTATVIGLGGMFLRTQAAPQPGSVMILTLKCPLVSFQSDCAVRHVTPTGLGIEFINLTADNEAILRRLLLQLKN
jgi:PilZ domain